MQLVVDSKTNICFQKLSFVLYTSTPSFAKTASPFGAYEVYIYNVIAHRAG